jgi:pimeloyl-ACP methyl ester carboxylesterase
MPDARETRTLSLDGRRTRVLSYGSGSQVIMALHPASPGALPLAGSADLLAPLLKTIALDGYQLVAPDLPGSGGTEALGLADLTVAGKAAFVARLVEELGEITALHLLAVGDAALPAFRLARLGLGVIPAASVFVVSPTTVAPSGDAAQNIALLHPPKPRWSPRSQRWTIRRLCYAPDRFPARVFAALERNAASGVHAHAVMLMEDAADGAALQSQLLHELDAFYGYCREIGYSMPITIFWGGQDVTATPASGLGLARILSGGPAPLAMHLANQCGHFGHIDRTFQLARTIEATMR